MNLILLGVCALVFLWVLVYHPEVALVVFFTLTIAQVNFSIPGTAIKLRPVLAFLLLARSITDQRLTTWSFLSLSAFRWLVFFFTYILMLSWGRDSLYPEMTRLMLLSIVTAYLGYYSFRLRGNSSILKFSIICAGLICLADLGYTYSFIGNFPVQRVYNLFFPNPDLLEELNDTNHNFYGFICGIAAVMVLTDYLSGLSMLKKLGLILLPLMMMGVIMSTSRSSLLGLAVAFVFIIVRGLRDNETRKKTVGLVTVAGGSVAGVLLVFIALQEFLDLDSAFISNISLRLVEEPVAVIRKNIGLSYNVQSLDAMDWRKESASIAFEAFGNLPVDEQFLGVGIGGYLQRDLGQNGLNPHNGILYILVETGLVGFMIYFGLLIHVLVHAFKRKPLSPLVLVLVFIVFYSLGQNEELLAPTAILFISTLISENHIVGSDEHLPVRRVIKQLSAA